MKQASPPTSPHAETRMGRRVVVIGALFCLGFLALAASLSRHQLWLAEEYHRKEEGQTYRRVLKEGARGSIFDRNGILLAGNQPRFWAGVYLNELRGEFRRRYRMLQRDDSGVEWDHGLTWEARLSVLREKVTFLSRVIGRELELDEEKVKSHFQRRLILPLELCGELDRDEYARLIEQLPPESPIQIFGEPARYYPFGEVACHVVGYVSTGDLEDLELGDDAYEGVRSFGVKRRVGKAGLERSMDELLRGGVGWDVWRVDPLGFQFEKVSSREAKQGQDIYCSLDVRLQARAESALGGKRGALAAVSVETGEVLALASKPGYDLNAFSPFLSQRVFDDIDSRGAWLNRAVQGLYPPGSTFKVVTALAALGAPEYNPHREVYCGPSFTIGGRRFPENRPQGHGYVNLIKGLAVSSNVYFYQLGVETGIERISRQALKMGLGAQTGIELPFEAGNSIVPDPAWKRRAGRGGWLHGDTVNVAIGQGDLTVTPLQMALATAAIAGKRHSTPVTLLRGDGRPIPRPELSPREEEGFDLVIEGMRRCVQGGTGTSMRVEGLQIGAKTGTAQVFPGGVEKNLAWIIAFAPVDKPRIALAVVIEDTESRDPIYGGRTAGPIARVLIEDFMKYYP